MKDLSVQTLNWKLVKLSNCQYHNQHFVLTLARLVHWLNLTLFWLGSIENVNRVKILILTERQKWNKISCFSAKINDYVFSSQFVLSFLFQNLSASISLQISIKVKFKFISNDEEQKKYFDLFSFVPSFNLQQFS